MTTVECFYNEKTKEFLLRVNGHAGYNPGNDIVCSACSILTFTVWQAVHDLEDEKLLKNIVSFKNDGYMSIKAELININTSLNVLRGIVRGFEMLADEHPENVEVIGIDSIDNVCITKENTSDFYSVIKE